MIKKYLGPISLFKKPFIKQILIFLAYLLISLIFTFPLVSHLTTHSLGWEMDSYIYMWNVDTFWNEVFNFRNPFFTNRIFYPIGTNLIFHTYGVWPDILGIFFLNNLVLYMNLLIIISLALAAYTCFILLNYLTKHLPGSFISGLIYGFSPIMIAFILSQHYYFEWAALFLPLGLFVLFKFFDTLKTRYIAWLMLFFWMCFFTDYYTAILYIIIVFIAIIMFLLLFFIKKRKFFYQIFTSKKILSYVKALLPTLVLPLAFLFFFIFPLDEMRNKAFSQSNYAFYGNTNLAGFLIPSEINPILHKIHKALMSLFGLQRNYDTPSYFLGWGILGLAVTSFFINRKNKYVLTAGITGIVILLLSLGLIIRFGNIEITSQKLTPFYWFSQLPFMGLIDCPLRFPIAVQLSIAILIGIMVSKIKEKRILGKIIPGAVILFFCIEYATWNLPFSQVCVPSIYKELSKTRDNYTVLELPSGICESKGAFGCDWAIHNLHSRQMYWQTIHKKPRLGAYVSRISESQYKFFKNEPIISDLFRMTSQGGTWSNKSFSEAEISQFLDSFNIGYIIFSPNPRQTQFISAIEKIFGEHITDRQKSEGYVLYKVF